MDKISLDNQQLKANGQNELSDNQKEEESSSSPKISQYSELFGREYFFNYELSWLKFNLRVLNEALNVKNPLLERVKFIGIVCNNLDEFFQKRVGGIKRQIEAGIRNLPVDGMTPPSQLTAIRDDVKKMIQSYRDCFLYDLIPELRKQNIFIERYDDLNESQKRTIEHYFDSQLYPILTPLAVDQSHPFPLISNKSRSFAVELRQKGIDETLFARVKVPSNRPRWLEAENNYGKLVLVSIDEVIQAHIDRLFPGMEILSANIFRVTRNADIERNEEEADDLLELIAEELRERRFAEIVRLEMDINTPLHIKELLIEKMDVDWGDVFEMDGPIGLADCVELYEIEGYEDLRYKKWVPTLHPVFRHEMDEDSPDIFSIIRQGDFLVHHPYHSFETSVQRFVEEAASDPKVLAIKQTLYRTSSDSPLMLSLMNAADTGKQVAMLVELKARFDEKRNIEWAQKLEKAGVHVAYGLPGLKIHSKLTIVVREEADRIRRYVHLGTGNYHPKTAQLYEDIGLFTCNEKIASDVSELFNFLTGYATEQKYRKLIVAPNYMRDRMVELIDYEINQAKNGKKTRIIAKMNSLEDPGIIRKLYEASSHGIPIDLIVRGVCRLIPQKKGLSENIHVYSVIGRFLEHSRIFYFHHGGKNLYFIGSADWMHRNLDARVESLAPIENKGLKKYLKFIIDTLLNDECQRWELKKNGKYKKTKSHDYEVYNGTHDILMNHAIWTLEPIPKFTPE